MRVIEMPPKRKAPAKKPATVRRVAAVKATVRKHKTRMEGPEKKADDLSSSFATMDVNRPSDTGFDDLPDELKNKIWDQVFVDDPRTFRNWNAAGVNKEWLEAAHNRLMPVLDKKFDAALERRKTAMNEYDKAQMDGDIVKRWSYPYDDGSHRSLEAQTWRDPNNRSRVAAKLVTTGDELKRAEWALEPHEIQSLAKKRAWAMRNVVHELGPDWNDWGRPAKFPAKAVKSSIKNPRYTKYSYDDVNNMSNEDLYKTWVGMRERRDRDRETDDRALLEAYTREYMNMPRNYNSRYWNFKDQWFDLKNPVAKTPEGWKYMYDEKVHDTWRDRKQRQAYGERFDFER
eukprot:jgi/Mesvir1/19441/Mv10468-RA.1